MRAKLLTLFLGTLLGFATAPTSANGYIRRYHGAACRVQNSSTSTVYTETLGLLNNSASAATFVCPVLSDNDQPHQFVQVMTVHGQKGSSNGTVDSATTCVKFFAGNGFACSINTSVSSAGPWGLSPFLDPWFLDNGTSFPYVKLVLQPGSGIFGAFVVN
jgi:hypothetical protein